VAESLSDRIPKVALLLAVGGVLLPAMALLAYSRPGYFTSPTYLGGLALAEFLFAAVCLYRRIFFPLVILSFLMAGTGLPGAGGVWLAVRWAVLATGAFVGSFMMLKERRHRFGLFHALAIFAILSAIVSAAVSRYQELALMKAISLLLLFVYAGTGARLAVTGHENRFFNGLLNGCEIFVGGIFLFRLVGAEVMGNPNSLGAVMGVVAAPVLLWGTLLDEGSFAQRRRQICFLLALYLVFHSHARAGIASAFISCAVLCLALRRYRMLGQGIVILLILVASSALFDPEGFSKTVSSITSSIVYKGHDEVSVFASRESPWQTAMQSIKGHFWFGSGFGTTDTGQDASAHIGRYQGLATAEGTTSENGSSYLSIVSWVGVLGVVPFVLLLAGILLFIARTVAWMINTGSPLHPAIPLAMMALAGLVHATFEDWLFAAGYYLCVFYWSLAFVLVDIAPYAALPRFSVRSRPKPVHMDWGRLPQIQ